MFNTSGDSMLSAACDESSFQTSTDTIEDHLLTTHVDFLFDTHCGSAHRQESRLQYHQRPKGFQVFAVEESGFSSAYLFSVFS
jgi:hypothetical protein